MTFIHTNALPRIGFPQLYCLILSSRGDISTIWRPCGSVDWAGLNTVTNNLVACKCVPGVYRSIKAARGNTLTIRRPGNAKYSILLLVSIDPVSAKCRPYLHRASAKVRTSVAV